MSCYPKFEEKDDVWVSELDMKDLKYAKKYTTISLPWTFDRMQYGGNSQNGVNNRIMNIFKGVLNQNLLEKKLEEKGYSTVKDWTKYRETDLFDFEIGDNVYDVKTCHVYDEYSEQNDREIFSLDFLIENIDYPGPEWKRFFPATLPFTQINGIEEKDRYLFGISRTNDDIRKTEPDNDDGGFWVSGPCKDAFKFFQVPEAILKREEADQGFYVEVRWERSQNTLFDENNDIELSLIGEWDGERLDEVMVLSPGEEKMSENEYSSLSTVKLNHPSMLIDKDKLVISAESNYSGRIPKPTNPKIDLDNDDFDWTLTKDDFVNLHVPMDYKVYWLGWVPVEEFFEKFQKYESYFIPHPDNYDVNVPGKVTSKLREQLEREDRKRKKKINKGEDISRPKFSDLIDGDSLHGGFLLAAYRGGHTLGAGSYYYPPNPNAFREKALYILPADLNKMSAIE